MYVNVCGLISYYNEQINKDIQGEYYLQVYFLQLNTFASTKVCNLYAKMVQDQPNIILMFYSAL